MLDENIVCVARVPERARGVGREMLPAGFRLVEVPSGATASEAARIVAQARYFLGFIDQPMPPDFYGAMRGAIRLVQLLSAGYDQVDLGQLRDLRIPLATNGGANAVAVAEHAILLMLAVLRRLRTLDARTRAGEWRPSGSDAEVYELDGRQVGLVGLGAVGRQVAIRLRPFGVRLRYCDLRRIPADEERALDIAYVTLDELLATSDVVSLHVPFTPATRGLIDRNRLGAMKRGAVLVNTCRGEVVDESALCEALARQHLLGAGLDTFSVEPAPKHNPLFALPNVVVTPHLAGPTWESWRKRFLNGYANIERVAGGQRPSWVVPELADLAPWWAGQGAG
jgi:glyoxylate reductase/D-3-phosphoglycerate dehydrogenase